MNEILTKQAWKEIKYIFKNYHKEKWGKRESIASTWKDWVSSVNTHGFLEDIK